LGELGMKPPKYGLSTQPQPAPPSPLQQWIAASLVTLS
jgi:hypothetical protein